MTYVMVLVFMGMFGYIIYFMFHDSETVVANSSNQRQDTFEAYVIRGDIRTSDGQVVATTLVDEEGNETRNYPYGSLFAHTVGYSNYGGSGLELSSSFDLLTSHVDVGGKVINELNENKNPGDTVVTTLDTRLQQAAANALGGCTGAVVVLEATTSRVLAMYSNPTFDPNDMDNVWEYAHSAEYSGDAILLNRASQGLYAPGSTFKVITAMEYIREHPDDYQNYYYNCEGSGIYSSVKIHCIGSTVHGGLDLTGSLANSCNTSFSNIGVNEIDLGGLCELTDKLLFNKELPYDGQHSKSRFALTKDSETYEIPQTVIGQGDTLISPLHNALIMQSIANGGIMMKPMLVDRIENVDGFVISTNKPKSYGAVLEPELTQKIIPLLEAVCTQGTASYYMASKPYTTAGKTGTAEYDDYGNCNSWFVGYSNVENPDIVVSVIVEDYNINNLSATYVASQVMDAYYNSAQ